MVIEVSTDSLKPHDFNIKIYGEEDVNTPNFIILLNDIKENGLLSPIIITKDNTIISGHRRWLCAKKLGLETVPCEIKDFETEEKVKLALISYNKNRIKTYLQEMQEIDEEKDIRTKMGVSTSFEQMAESRNMSKGTYHRKTYLWNEAKEGNEYAQKQIKQVIENDKSIAKAYNDLLEEKNRIKIKEARREAAKLGKTLDENKELHFGDFKDVLDFIPDNTVDVILTDPPYPIEFINCWEDLGKFAFKKLRPGGWLIAYSGQRNLPLVFERLSKSELKYYWMFSLYHNGTKQDVWGVDVNVMWKPILIYAKAPVMKLENKGKDDYIVSDREEKTDHDWQQSESGVAKLIETFSVIGDLVVDPFAGSGTTLIVGKKLGRKVVGSEINEETYNIAKANLDSGIDRNL